MNKTKLKIIKKSIELFNEYGFSNVSLFKIAEDLKLSPGNLTYHYPKKDDLMSAVYDHFQSQMANVTPYTTASIGLKEMNRQMDLFFNLQQKFQFFYLDLLDIERAFPAIAERHYVHIQNQINQLHAVLQYNREQQSIRQYQNPSMYKRLAHQIWMTTVYWLSQTYVRGITTNPDELKEALWSLLYPHLTDKGQEELDKFYDISKFK